MLKKEELYLIKGGGVDWVVVGIIGALITFVAGVVDGQIKLK